MTGAETPPEKQAWFDYWLKTGTIFPDGNTCTARKAFVGCLQPYKFGTREPGDWMGMYFCLNAKGYLSHCIPTPANFGRLHGGQVSEVLRGYNDENRREYFKKLALFKREFESNSDNFKFIDREGNPVE